MRFRSQKGLKSVSTQYLPVDRGIARSSFIAEHGLTFIEEGGHAFGRIRGLKGERVEVGFDREPFPERSRQTAAHGVAGETKGGQAEARHLACETHSGSEHIAVDDAVDEADPQGLLGHDLRPVRIISSARASPISRGRRWVPP